MRTQPYAIRSTVGISFLVSVSQSQRIAVFQSQCLSDSNSQHSAVMYTIIWNPYITI